MATGIRAPIDRSTRRPAGQVIARTGVPLVAAAACIIGFMWILGSVLVNSSAPSILGRTDLQTTEWAVGHRTPNFDNLSHLGSMVADTSVALVVTAVAVVGLRLWLGRWRESLVVVVAVVGELLIFLVITATVHRARPAVPQLDQAPPTSSFPSGHTGAAVALYVCLAVILLRNAKPRWLAAGLAVLGCVIPIVVAASRVYRGMHYLTDVSAGALASGIWLTVVLVTLLPTATANRVDRTEGART
jgi:undecaprenyl-diphosphatase